MDEIKLEIGKHELVLLPEKAVFWKNRDILIIADAHFGKVAHFRSEGIAVSPGAAGENLSSFAKLVQKFDPDRIIFLGDIFHSSYNREWDRLSNLFKQLKLFSRMDLVQGNHDILHPDLYELAGINLNRELIEFHPFIFSHHPMAKQEIKEGQINIAGHIHPGVRLQGPGKQHTKLPCFYMKENRQLILPSFGVFTGIYKIRPSRQDRVFVIVENQIMEIPVD
ncbi:MAG: ligase-associated DNA damage response endonuclease PdeM [Bacteroidales bacterium]